jgi:hypothetical protein
MVNMCNNTKIPKSFDWDGGDSSFERGFGFRRKSPYGGMKGFRPED